MYTFCSSHKKWGNTQTHVHDYVARRLHLGGGLLGGVRGPTAEALMLQTDHFFASSHMQLLPSVKLLADGQEQPVWEQAYVREVAGENQKGGCKHVQGHMMGWQLLFGASRVWLTVATAKHKSNVQAPCFVLPLHKKTELLSQPSQCMQTALLGRPLTAVLHPGVCAADVKLLGLI